jgi:hypothetical protein
MVIPVDSQSKLCATAGNPVADPLDRSLASALQYLTLTRPDLTYVVQQVCLFMHDPREPHLALIKRILRYVKGTSTPVCTSAFAACHPSQHTPTLTRLDVQTLGALHQATASSSETSWFPTLQKRQTTVSRSQSSVEAEYRAVAHAIAKCCWLRQLLEDLHISIPSATIVYCDSVSAIYMTVNPVHHRRTKHIEHSLCS